MRASEEDVRASIGLLLLLRLSPELLLLLGEGRAGRGSSVVSAAIEQQAWWYVGPYLNLAGVELGLKATRSTQSRRSAQRPAPPQDMAKTTKRVRTGMTRDLRVSRVVGSARGEEAEGRARDDGRSLRPPARPRPARASCSGPRRRPRAGRSRLQAGWPSLDSCRGGESVYPRTGPSWDFHPQPARATYERVN